MKSNCPQVRYWAKNTTFIRKLLEEKWDCIMPKLLLVLDLWRVQISSWLKEYILLYPQWCNLYQKVLVFPTKGYKLTLVAHQIPLYQLFSRLSLQSSFTIYILINNIGTIVRIIDQATLSTIAANFGLENTNPSPICLIVVISRWVVKRGRKIREGWPSSVLLSLLLSSFFYSASKYITSFALCFGVAEASNYSLLQVSLLGVLSRLVPKSWQVLHWISVWGFGQLFKLSCRVGEVEEPSRLLKVDEPFGALWTTLVLSKFTFDFPQADTMGHLKK